MYITVTTECGSRMVPGSALFGSVEPVQPTYFPARANWSLGSAPASCVLRPLDLMHTKAALPFVYTRANPFWVTVCEPDGLHLGFACAAAGTSETAAVAAIAAS